MNILFIIVLSVTSLSIFAKETNISELPTGKISCIDRNYKNLELNFEIYEDKNRRFIEVSSYKYQDIDRCNGVCKEIEGFHKTPYIIPLSREEFARGNRDIGEVYTVTYDYKMVRNNTIQEYKELKFIISDNSENYKNTLKGAVVFTNKRKMATRDAIHMPGMGGILWLECKYN